MRAIFRIISISVLLFSLLLGAYLVYEEVVYGVSSRATYGLISQSNSLVVGTPSCVQADGTTRQRLYIYCNNARGFGEPNVPVTVKPMLSTLSLEVIPIQGITDFSGKAVFDLTSRSNGSHSIEVRCSETRIAPEFKSCFTN